MKQQILTMLRETEGYLSGQEICEKLKVSRTAVWKIMKQLQEQGYEIEGIKNKGYRLLSVPDIMTEEEIMSQIKTRYLAKRILCFSTIDSTNIQAKQYAEEKDADGLLIVSDEQKKGRGRRGRSWSSPPGENIFMSILMKPKISPESASMLTLIAALAIASGIETMTRLEVKIKWPNDIIVNKKKVCGILTEMNSELDYIHYVVVGIGINVNTKTFPPEIAETASSLYIERGKQPVNRSRLICMVMEQMEKYYEIFLKTGDLSGVREEYNHRLAGVNAQVKVIGEKTEMVGVSRGINPKGELVVEYSDGSRREVMSGEVSVRGLYGYV